MLASHNHLSATSVVAFLPFCCSPAAALKPSGLPIASSLPPSVSVATPTVLIGAQLTPPPGVPRPPRPCGVTLLTNLNLSGNAVGDMGVRRLRAQMCAGGLECALQVLSLEGCGLTARCAPAIEEMLLNARTLTALSLAWNNFDMRGASALARGLESNISLRQLNVAWTGIGNSGCAHLAEALKINAALQVIDLTGNNAGYGACVVIAEVVARSATLREVVLHHNALTQQGIRALLRAALQREGRGPAVMLQRASFVRADASQLPTTLDPVNPDGSYSLNLADPTQRQVAIDMLECAPSAPRFPSSIVTSLCFMVVEPHGPAPRLWLTCCTPQVQFC